ncbi:formamidopyrimidine-DNA glycosylase isoform X1 [Syzygium oleosum]|uniref:formamidopyrimidine-DNA glycosylase isoform X1 n=1 Tax=Syzygium oleosum TaxID=219896 RepID=UPI0011D233C6|nr:formamidopyrimidine-DNA glycosylase isoform X1 [Syzygium oleosum]
MPELPEVEAARRAVEDHCVGQKIKRAVVADDPKVIEGVSPSAFQSSLVGKTVVAAKRKGKSMWLQLDSPPFPSFQFGMAGAVYIKGVAVTKYKRSAVKDTDEWPSKYSKVFIELENGLELSFTDKRRFARVRLLNDPTSVPPISELGPDALLEPMTIDEFTESLRKKKIAIKTLLLDQSFIAGIGNWIADEVLYQAKIHPLETASSLPKENCATLHKCIKEVIEKAIEVGADSSQFPSNWIFHTREKKPGKAFVDGKRIDFITAGGRTTAYVPDLQKLSGANAVNAANKRGKQTSKRKKRGQEEEEDDDDDGVAIEEDKITETFKSKNAHKPRGQGRKSSTRRKPKESDDESDEADIGEEDESSYGNGRNEQKKRTRGAIKNEKGPEKAVNKKTQPARNSQKQKKRAK